MNSSNLIHSSNALTSKATVKKNWVRVSHSLLDLSIDILKNSFGYENDVIRNNRLFLAMIDLFKLTLFFICDHRMYRPIFEDCEDLCSLASKSSAECDLIRTFQTVRHRFRIKL